MDESDIDETERMRAALRGMESVRGHEMAGFEAIRRHIASSPSPMAEPRWGLARSARIAVSLVAAQFRIAAWLIIPVALLSAGLAVLTARLLGAADSASAVTSGFVALMLAGVALTMAMAVSRRDPDSISLITPVGPASVLLARVTMVFVVDCAVGLGASWIAASWGPAAAVGPLVLAWFVPMVVVAGLATLLAVWASPWVAAVVGVMAVPVLAPAPEGMMRVGMGAVIGVVHDAVPAAATIALGLALFAVALLLARRLTVSHSLA